MKKFSSLLYTYKELYCDAVIFVFWFFIVYLPKKKWKLKNGPRLLTLPYYDSDQIQLLARSVSLIENYISLFSDSSLTISSSIYTIACLTYLFVIHLFNLRGYTPCFYRTIRHRDTGRWETRIKYTTRYNLHMWRSQWVQYLHIRSSFSPFSYRARTPQPPQSFHNPNVFVSIPQAIQ